VAWKSGGARVKALIARINGVEVYRLDGQVLTEAGGDQGVANVPISLGLGQNWIEVSVQDDLGRYSDTQRFRILLKRTQNGSCRYVISLGVSKYTRPELNLTYAAKDASDVAASLMGATRTLKPSHEDDTFLIDKSAITSTKHLLLTDEEVGMNVTEKIRDFLSTSLPADEVILFCAGHGVLGGNLEYYFAGHDFDPQQVEKTGIALDDLLAAMSSARALKRLMLLDTCHAGIVGEKDEVMLAANGMKLPSGVRAIASRGMQVKPVLNLDANGCQCFIEEIFSLPSSIYGVNIIGASGGAQFALESERWKNGVFTAAIIEGLYDRKADSVGGSNVSVAELRDYLAKRVSELTEGRQKPSVISYDSDQEFLLLK
jgi:hypothetical protein